MYWFVPLVKEVINYFCIMM